MHSVDTSTTWNTVLKAGIKCDESLGEIAEKREKESRLWGTNEDAQAVDDALNIYARAISDALKQLLPILRADDDSYHEALNLLQRVYENRREDAVRRCRVVPDVWSFRDLRRSVVKGVTVGNRLFPSRIPIQFRLNASGPYAQSEGLAVAAIWGRLGLATATRDPIAALRIEKLDQELRKQRYGGDQ